MALKKHPGRKYSPSEIWGYHQDTASELKLAKALKKAGVSFEREVPIKQFTVDFLVDEWLIVEVDGWSHLTSSRQVEDRNRQSVLEDSGFSVVRIPAMDISHQAGLKQWVSKIMKISKQGPPGLTRAGFENLHLKKEVETVRHKLMEQARRAGIAAQKRKRQVMRSGDNQRAGASRRYSGTGESMNDYFGPEAEDFEKLLEQYDWSKAPDKDEPEKRRNARKRSRHK